MDRKTASPRSASFSFFVEQTGFCYLSIAPDQHLILQVFEVRAILEQCFCTYISFLWCIFFTDVCDQQSHEKYKISRWRFFITKVLYHTLRFWRHTILLRPWGSFFPFQHTYPLVVILSQFGLFESTWF